MNTDTHIDIHDSFSQITLMDMRSEIDLGEIILQDGSESAQQVAIWLVQRYYWAHPLHNRESLSRAVHQAILEQAKYMACAYFVNEWGDLGERAFVCLLTDAQSTGWHTSKEYNFHSLEEMVASMLEGQSTAVGISTWMFVVKVLVPAAARYGIHPSLLFGASTQVRKLRELVPVARRILDDPNLSEQSKENYLRYFIEKAADPSVNHPAFKRETDQFRERRQRQVPKLVGYECIMPNKETWIVIRCVTPLDETVVEMLLGHKVDLRVTDWRAFTGLIAQMMQGFGDLSEVDKTNLIPKMIKLLEGSNNGRDQTTSQPTEGEARVLSPGSEADRFH